MDKAPSALIFTNVRGGLLPSGNVADRCLPATKALAHSLREASRPLWGMETFPSLEGDSGAFTQALDERMARRVRSEMLRKLLR